jgi:hypothetical protein
VSITPPVPNGHTLTIYRDTPKDLPVADFLDGAIINETNLDFIAKQSVFVSAEMVDRLNLFANEAHQALINSEQAITFAQATINGDFTLFLRGNVANNWTVGQNFPVGTQIAGSAIATQSYVTSALGSYATSANLSAAVTTAATDATTKATAAQTAAAADATNKVNIETNRAKSMEGFLLCIALR